MIRDHARTRYFTPARKGMFAVVGLLSVLLAGWVALFLSIPRGEARLERYVEGTLEGGFTPDSKWLKPPMQLSVRLDDGSVVAAFLPPSQSYVPRGRVVVGVYARGTGNNIWRETRFERYVDGKQTPQP